MSDQSDDQWATKLEQANSLQICSNRDEAMSGIAPASFHKKRRTCHEQSSTEKHLEEMLQLALKNEVMQKRKNFTDSQNLQLDAYESVTSFRIFPLQVCWLPRRHHVYHLSFIYHLFNVYVLIRLPYCRILPWCFWMK
jgi:hypothetical protein